MAETLTQQVSRSSKCAEKPLLFLVLFCIAASVVGLVIIYTLRCPGCSSVTSSSVVYTYWVATVVLFLLGVMLLALTVYYKRRQHSTTSRVVISSIPAEDLEKHPLQHYITIVSLSASNLTRPHQRIQHRWICPIIFLLFKILMKFIHL